MYDTVVIGGGLAGLAAAAALAQQGQRVCLIESRNRLGGRASSVVDRQTGQFIDTGQHVLMGCCTNLLHLCRTLGLDKHLQWHERLFFISPVKAGRCRTTVFKAVNLPAPFHLLPAVWQSRFMDSRSKRAVVRALIALAGAGPEKWDEPFADWLRQWAQPDQAVKRFWQVILVSALSERLERISVRYARQVFLQGFLAHRRAWQLIVPTVPLGQLFGSHSLERLRSWGVDVQLQVRARRVLEADGRAVAVELSDGRLLKAANFVLAVPHSIAEKVAPRTVCDMLQRLQTSRLPTASIASVHLWFDRPITDLPHAVLLDCVGQWIFAASCQAGTPAEAHSTVLCAEHFGKEGSGSSVPGRSHSRYFADRRTDRPPTLTAAQPFYYQVVVSDAGWLAALNRDAIVAHLLDELRQAFPRARSAELLTYRMFVQRQAVFSPAPGVDRHRPGQTTTLSNFVLAGDWTATGWPSTMEGAVRSGFLAAENVLAQRGRPVKLVQPDLPVSAITRLLMRGQPL